MSQNQGSGGGTSGGQGGSQGGSQGGGQDDAQSILSELRSQGVTNLDDLVRKAAEQLASSGSSQESRKTYVGATSYVFVIGN
jgi:hypothetical protein